LNEYSSHAILDVDDLEIDNMFSYIEYSMNIWNRRPNSPLDAPGNALSTQDNLAAATKTVEARPTEDSCQRKISM
jgi:hypothetical protein